MNDHKSKNALSNKMIFALMNAISSACDDNSIKVIVIAANGNVFSAGHDLKEITEARKSEDNGDSFYKLELRIINLHKDGTGLDRYTNAVNYIGILFQF